MTEQIGLKDVFELLMKRIDSHEREVNLVKSMVQNIEKYADAIERSEAELDKIKDILEKMRDSLEDSKSNSQNIKRLEEALKALAHWKDKFNDVISIADLKEVKDAIKVSNSEITQLKISLAEQTDQIKDFTEALKKLEDSSKGGIDSRITGAIGAIAGSAGAVLVDIIQKKLGG